MERKRTQGEIHPPAVRTAIKGAPNCGRTESVVAGPLVACDRPARTLVSIVLAVRNEAVTVESCLTSLVKQETPDFDLEILAIDGESTDGTREILQQAASRDSRIRVLRNEKKKTPFAFNLGLKEARGEFVAILGAHTLYAPDYIATCLKELLAQNAGGCGGRVITSPANDTLEARLVATVLSHPFGSSRKSFRTQREGFVDTVNYPLFRKSALLEVGGYSEELHRNQDNDMNQRLREKGYKLYCTWQTHCLYRPKGTLRGLMNYAYGNGFWNLISFKRNSAAMAARHFIPFFFLLAILATVLLALAGILIPWPYAALAAVPFALVLGLHLVCGNAAALLVAIRQKWLGALWLPFAFLGFHLSYGFGTFRAFLTHAEPAPRQNAKTSEQEGCRQEGNAVAL